MEKPIQINDISIMETVIGTPSAQKVIVLLVTWPNLSIKEIQSKTKLSKSQIHITLKNLQDIQIVQTVTRGYYTLAESKFTQLLKEAYQAKIIESINKQIYQIKQALKRKEIKEATEMFQELQEKYDPLLKERFPFIVSSLSHRFIEAYK